MNQYMGGYFFHPKRSFREGNFATLDPNFNTTQLRGLGTPIHGGSKVVDPPPPRIGADRGSEVRPPPPPFPVSTCANRKFRKSPKPPKKQELKAWKAWMKAWKAYKAKKK